jgi:hypothetical protein
MGYRRDALVGRHVYDFVGRRPTGVAGGVGHSAEGG